MLPCPKWQYTKIATCVDPKTYHLNINSALLRRIVDLYDASDFITSAKYYYAEVWLRGFIVSSSCMFGRLANSLAGDQHLLFTQSLSSKLS